MPSAAAGAPVYIDVQRRDRRVPGYIPLHRVDGIYGAALRPQQIQLAYTKTPMKTQRM